eukprot:TRINITY_DN2338_c0_g1_i5.p3 TRINITY_DN2338_c0_g1~~TRINITY_DN2338_c0_g1_i5.p3  ORF type:complete len:427 (-),score=132.61 TRINITY_DN2338_c0_g1_i5:2799-4079(-)
MANTIVFVYSGVLVTAFSWSCAGVPHEWQDYLFILAYFAFLQVLRFSLLGIFHPALAWRQKWYTWRQATVVGLSGLRGAVSLILALEVGESETIPDEVRSRVVLWTTGVVALSLLVNGLAISPALSWLGLNKADPAKADFLARARALMQQKTYQILDLIVIDGFFKSARWSYVRDNVIPKSWTDGDAAENYMRASLDLHPGRTSLSGLQTDMRRSMDIHHANRRMSIDPGGGGRNSTQPPWRTPPQSPRPGADRRGSLDRSAQQSTERLRGWDVPSWSSTGRRSVPTSPRLSSNAPLYIPTIRPVEDKRQGRLSRWATYRKKAPDAADTATGGGGGSSGQAATSGAAPGGSAGAPSTGPGASSSRGEDTSGALAADGSRGSLLRRRSSARTSFVYRAPNVMFRDLRRKGASAKSARIWIAKSAAAS